MFAKGVKAEFDNLEIHMGEFNKSKFKMKCDVTYEELMLTLDGGDRVVRLHARNISNVHMEKKAIRVAAINFEIKEGDKISVASGAIKIELGKDADAWYKEIWG